MKKNLSEWLRFIYRFGVVKGGYLYLSIKAGKQQNINVPGIKYPISLRKYSSDYETFYQAIVHDQYNFNYKINPKIIIDGGANIGLASIALKNIFPDAKIIAIEPDKENFEQLNKNVSPYIDISTIQAGLWNRKAILNVSDKYNKGKWAMVTEEVEIESPDSITTITIIELMQLFKVDRIDILKLDIETAERELFSSAYAEWLPKVKVIIIELHDFIKKGTSKPFFKAINETFENYSFFQLGENTIIINEDMVLSK